MVMDWLLKVLGPPHIALGIFPSRPERPWASERTRMRNRRNVSSRVGRPRRSTRRAWTAWQDVGTEMNARHERRTHIEPIHCALTASSSLHCSAGLDGKRLYALCKASQIAESSRKCCLSALGQAPPIRKNKERTLDSFVTIDGER